MTDIVERLRDAFGDCHCGKAPLLEAADTIERLQAALQRRTDALHSIGIGGNGDRNWTLDEVRAVAWDALEPRP